MRLNNSDRDAFVRAVLQDVPSENYPERAQALALAAMKNAAPQCVKDVEVLNGYELARSSVHLGAVGYVYSPYAAPYSDQARFRAAFPDVWTQIDAMNTAYAAQKTARYDLQRELRSAIYGCSTLKQAKERFPDLIKYLPTDRSPKATAQVPAISNIMPSLRAAGWPLNTAA